MGAGREGPGLGPCRAGSIFVAGPATAELGPVGAGRAGLGLTTRLDGPTSEGVGWVGVGGWCGSLLGAYGTRSGRGRSGLLNARSRRAASC